MLMSPNCIAGVDIGGTWIRVAISDLSLKESLIKVKLRRTPKETKFSIGEGVCKLLYELLNENGYKKDELIAIGLATAGPINTEQGIVFNNANLGFREIPLREPIQKEFPDTRFHIMNDGNAAVLGVHFFEASEEEKDNLIYLTISTGIGAGVICNGHLLTGKDGNAAEVGHALVKPRSKAKCNCGAYGCWEAFSSGTGVRNRALEEIELNHLNYDVLKKNLNNDISTLTAKEVFQAARKGDELSAKIVNDCVFYSKVGIGIINNHYDSTTIYVGGAMMRDHEIILPPIRKQFQEEPILFTINRPPNIKLTKFREDVGLKGALALVKYKIENHKVLN